MTGNPAQIPGAVPKDDSPLPRVLGAWSAASILIGSIIGSGIFVKPQAVAASLPSPGWILVSWIVSGALALIGSLIFAELGSLFPESGGQYTYIREAFGRLPAFLFGWTTLSIVNSASIAALAVMSSKYCCNFLGPNAPGPESHWGRTLPVILIVMLTSANIAGVRWGAGIQNLLTVVKLAAVGLIIAGLLLPWKMSYSNLLPFWEIRGAPRGEALWQGFKGAFLAIFWAYDGWYLLSFSGGEIRNPRRNIPIGFILGILAVIGVYLAVNVAYFCAIDLETMKGLTDRFRGGVAAEAASRLYGEVGLVMVSAGVVGSTLGAANGNLLTGPRLAFAMARDRLFLPGLGMVHPRFLTPARAIFLQGLLASIYVYAGTFDQLTDSVVFAAWIFYLLTVASCFVFRRRHPDRPGAFRAPGHPALPAIFIAFAAIFLAYSFLDSAASARAFLADPADPAARNGIYPVVVIAIILSGLPFYALLRRQSRS